MGNGLAENPLFPGLDSVAIAHNERAARTESPRRSRKGEIS